MKKTISNRKKLSRAASKAVYFIVAFIKTGIHKCQIGIPVLLFIYYWGSAFKLGNEYQSKSS